AQLHAAVLADRQVRLRYRGREGVERCVVDPWGLVVKAGVWYLVAAEGGETRLFRVSRVEEAVQTDEVARRPRALDLDAEWTRLRRQVEEMYGSPVAVELRVRDDTLALLERVCGRHLVQGGPRPVPDGEGWHRMALEFPVLGAARARLLGFGDAVEVLTPPELREEMHDVAAGVVRLYAGVDVHPG
ncbi:MAG TPA: WYL domain-containing protein, partial [Cryptosporangiaceae bacterium]|nr:WYL domain-containing protein [Cryptosporangiaceae bacterium]